MTEPNALMAFVELYCAAHTRWIAATDKDESGEVVREPINIDPAVRQELRRHLWTYHPSDAMGYSEFVRRGIEIELALQRAPMYTFGEKWRTLQTKAHDFFVPGACAKSWQEIGVHAQEIVFFMEAAAIVVDEVPLDAIDRIVNGTGIRQAYEKSVADRAEVNKWIAANRAARKALAEQENTE